MSERKKALGRGLGALFGDDITTPVPITPPARAKTGTGKQAAASKTANTTNVAKAKVAAEPASENAILYISIDDIRPNAAQPRKSFAPETIEELATSIKTYGVVQPVLVKKTKLGYELIAGERRLRAARKAGLKTVPAILKKVTKEENALLALIENMQREDLQPLDEAAAYKAVLEEYGMTQEALSKAIGKSRSHIANTLRLLKFPERVLVYLREGKLTLGHANALGAVKTQETLAKLAERIVRESLSVRDAERICSAAAQKEAGKPALRKKPRKDSRKSEEVRRVEEELTSLLGTKVVITGDKAGGAVELRYFDRAGLEDIIELLRKVAERKK